MAGQDRLHLVEAELAALKLGRPLEKVPHLERLHPRCLRYGGDDTYALICD
jgi:hypothetical protein